MYKLRLEPTAALVMQWALSLYREEPIQKFIDRLDLSSGSTLYTKCNAVCDWYGEVIFNRKSFIKHLIEQSLTSARHEYQLVFLGAGKSPLSAEILLKHACKVYRIFEVDLSGMEEKTNLYTEIFPEFRDKVRCINADILSHDILSILDSSENGYRHDLPVIVLMEGISYYLSKQKLNKIIAGFQREKEAIFIIEYLVPIQFVDKSRRLIPQEVFRIIGEDCGLGEIASYTMEELRAFFREKGGDLLAGYTMADMESKRTGANTYFKKPSDGWIECVVGRVGTLHDS